MKQLNFLGAPKSAAGQDAKKLQPESLKFEIFVDGASRGNPGAAGVGIYCKKNGTTFFKQGFFIGFGTNNFAEYAALLCALFLLKAKLENVEKPLLNVYSDSQLLVYQINGLYKTKNPMIKIFMQRMRKLLQHFSWSVIHIPREKNAMADALANQGLDEKIELSPELKKLINPNLPD